METVQFIRKINFAATFHQENIKNTSIYKITSTATLTKDNLKLSMRTLLFS